MHKPEEIQAAAEKARTHGITGLVRLDFLLSSLCRRGEGGMIEDPVFTSPVQEPGHPRLLLLPLVECVVLAGNWPALACIRKNLRLYDSPLSLSGMDLERRRRLLGLILVAPRPVVTFNMVTIGLGQSLDNFVRSFPKNENGTPYAATVMGEIIRSGHPELVEALFVAALASPGFLAALAESGYNFIRALFNTHPPAFVLGLAHDSLSHVWSACDMRGLARSIVEAEELAILFALGQLGGMNKPQLYGELYAAFAELLARFPAGCPLRQVFERRWPHPAQCQPTEHRTCLDLEEEGEGEGEAHRLVQPSRDCYSPENSYLYTFHMNRVMVTTKNLHALDEALAGWKVPSLAAANPCLMLCVLRSGLLKVLRRLDQELAAEGQGQQLSPMHPDITCEIRSLLELSCHDKAKDRELTRHLWSTLHRDPFFTFADCTVLSWTRCHRPGCTLAYHSNTVWHQMARYPSFCRIVAADPLFASTAQRDRNVLISSLDQWHLSPLEHAVNSSNQDFLLAIDKALPGFVERSRMGRSS